MVALRWYGRIVQWKHSLRFTSRKPEWKGKSTWYVWRVPEPGGAGGWHSMLDILRRYCSNASWRTHHKVGRRNTQRRRGGGKKVRGNEEEGENDNRKERGKECNPRKEIWNKVLDKVRTEMRMNRNGKERTEENKTILTTMLWKLARCRFPSHISISASLYTFYLLRAAHLAAYENKPKTSRCLIIIMAYINRKEKVTLHLDFLFL